MPRQQVYGKRSRAVYDPFAVFASPQHSAVVRNSQPDVDQIAEQASRSCVSPCGCKKNKENLRKPLGQRNANSVTCRPSTSTQATKPKRRKPKRVVTEEENGGDGRSNEHEEHDGPSGDRELVVVESSFHLEPPLKIVIPQSETKQGVRRDDTTKAAGSEIDNENKAPCSDAVSPQSAGAEWEDILSPVIALPPTVPKRDVYSVHCADLLSLAAHPLTSFAQWSEQLCMHFTVAKIAEASFGEVYRLSLIDPIDNFSRSDESVLKIIALKAPACTIPNDKKKRAAALKKAEAMSNPDDVANEVKLLQRMSSIPGFTNFRDVRVLQGRPAPAFAQAFKEYNAGQKAKKKDLSHFPDPAKKASYSDDQLWAVIEMQDAGSDLERYVESGQSTSVWSTWDIFWQVVLSLAKGEEGAEFEHRDLHLGNICVRQRPSPGTTQAPPAEDPIDIKRKLNFTNLETTIIDYTISRALMPDASIAYHDLSQDPSLFEGDSTQEYQYDIYRYMRGAVFLDNAVADQTYFANRLASSSNSSSTPTSWRHYHPITNLVWLHFVLYELLEQLTWPSAGRAPPKKKSRQAHAVWKRANDLERTLLTVQDLLQPEVLGRSGVRAASDLVGLALAEGWLDVKDVVGEGGESNWEEAEEDSEAGELAAKLQKLVVVDEVPTDSRRHR